MKRSPSPESSERAEFARLLGTLGNGSSAEFRAALESVRRPNACDADGRTLLHHAAVDGLAAQASLLIEHGWDVSIADSNGWTPLNLAALHYQPRVVEVLIAAAAPVDKANNDGNTPLWNAAFKSQGRGEVIALLLGAGADRSRKNKHGVSPLDVARTIANYRVPLLEGD